MDKLTRTLSQSLNRFQKRIESLLETDEAPAPDNAPAFEASRDVALVRGLSLALPDDHIDRAIVVFGRLAGLFEAGVLLENHDSQWKAQAIFQNGLARPLRREMSASMRLPEVGPLTALQTPARSLLAKLELTDLDPSNKRRAILVKPVPDFAYILLSELPDLWLKDHLERTVKALTDGFAG